MLKLNLADPRTHQPPQPVEDTSTPLRQEIADLRHACERVQHSCEELRADLDWVAGQVASVRGHITGGSRKPKGEPPPPETNGHQQLATIEQINVAIRNGTFRAR